MNAPTDLDLLIDYLDGSLSPEAESHLIARLKAEPALAQELVRLARSESILREWARAMQIASADTLEPRAEPVAIVRPGRPSAFSNPIVWLAGVALLVLVGLIVVRLTPVADAPGPPGTTSVADASGSPKLVVLARLLELVGQVELFDPTGKRSVAEPGQDLYPGQTLQVRGDGSQARVVYADGSRLEITADSTARFEGGQGSVGKQIVLLEGYLCAEIKRQPTDRPMILTTPHALIRVPGTRFSLATQREATRVELEAGQLQVIRTSDGQSVEVTEGLYAIIARDEPALMPEPLPPRMREYRDRIRHGGGPILNLAFAPDSSLLAIAGWDGSILLWDADRRQPWRQWKAHKGRIKGLTWVVGSKTILTTGSDRQVKLWDTFTGEEKPPLIKLRREADALALSADRKTLAVALAQNRGSPGSEQVRLYDLTTGQEIGKLVGHNRPISGLVFLPDGETLATAGRDEVVKLWSVQTGMELATLRGHVGQINAIAVDSDGRTLATGGRDGVIKLWDVLKRSEIRSLPGHPREVRSVAFSPDGRLLASCGTDASARLWDLHSGQELMHLTGLAHASPAVAFSHDGRFLSASSWEPQVKVWEVPAQLRPGP